MRFSVAAVLALASAVFAQDATDGFNVVTKPTEGESVPAGETYEIVWTPDTKYGDKPVSITLVGGKSQPEQQVIELLAGKLGDKKNQHNVCCQRAIAV